MTEPNGDLTGSNGEQAPSPAWTPQEPWQPPPPMPPHLIPSRTSLSSAAASGPPTSGPPGAPPPFGPPASAVPGSAVPVPAAWQPYPPPGGVPPGVPQPVRPPGWAVPVPPPPPQAARPVRVEALPGTPFGVAYLGVSPTVSGLAVGSMVAGIGSVLVAMVVVCFGLAGAQSGWGPLVAGAFAILAALVGGTAAAAGIVAMRQIRRAAGAASGRGLAVTGLACGASGVGLTLLGFLLAVALSRGG